MQPALVVDVGNSLIKWGRCAADAVVEKVALPPDDPAAWQRQLDAWNLHGRLTWVLAGVHRARLNALAAWLQQRGDTVRVLERADQLPLTVQLEHPDRVGIDRLLNAVAARRTATPAVIIDAGSAVTVDYVDAQGAFRGGAIFPGLRLMAKALHNYTDLLPQIEVRQASPPALGTSTIAAMHAGIYYAVVGGINTLIERLGEATSIFLTGGDAALLQPCVAVRAVVWPNMTLEGIRLSAAYQP
jgi:type III pantothenate kinase